MTTLIVCVVVAIAGFVTGVLFGRRNKSRVEDAVSAAKRFENKL